MEHSERLVYTTRCRLCGGEIETGTPLENLSWDPERRVWVHRSPRCEGAATAGGGEVTPLAAPANKASPSASPPAETKVTPQIVDTRLPTEATFGDWSATVEFHEAEDPAQSKKVVRIARLHLRSLREAREVAELLRGDV